MNKSWIFQKWETLIIFTDGERNGWEAGLTLEKDEKNVFCDISNCRREFYQNWKEFKCLISANVSEIRKVLNGTKIITYVSTNRVKSWSSRGRLNLEKKINWNIRQVRTWITQRTRINQVITNTWIWDHKRHLLKWKKRYKVPLRLQNNH